jgi:hypothetical protein
MQEHANQYLDRALEYEAKAAQDPLMKKSYEELARSYRTLATYVAKAKVQSRPPAAFADIGVLS